MKAKFVLIISLLIPMVPAMLLARTDPGTDAPSIQRDAQASEASDTNLGNVLSTPSASPRGPQEVLNDYQAEMVAITQRFSARVAAIAEAVQSGQMSSEQGQKL